MSNVRTFGLLAVLGAFALVGGCSSDDSSNNGGTNNGGTSNQADAATDAATEAAATPSCMKPTDCETGNICCLNAASLSASAPTCQATCTGLFSIQLCAQDADCGTNVPCQTPAEVGGLVASAAAALPAGAADAKICVTADVRKFAGGTADGGTDGAVGDGGTDAATDGATGDAATDAPSGDSAIADAATGG